MARTALQNNKGFTLLETVIAMTILTVMMLGTLQALIGTYQFARKNTLRDHAVKLADEVLTDFRNTPFSALANGTQTAVNYQRQINNANIAYTTTATIAEPVTNVAKTVQLVTTWAYKGNQYNVTTTTIVANK